MNIEISNKIKIILVDDNKMFLDSIYFYLSHLDKYIIINTAGDGEEFLKLNNIGIADIILMDIEMPKLNGILATKTILDTFPFLKIVAITSYEEKAYLKELIFTGFKGCIFKKNTLSQIDQAIETVVSDKLFFLDMDI